MLENNHLLKAIYDLFEAIMIGIHDIMNHINDIKNDKKPFLLHEHSWYRRVLLKMSRFSDTEFFTAKCKGKLGKHFRKWG